MYELRRDTGAGRQTRMVVLPLLRRSLPKERLTEPPTCRDVDLSAAQSGQVPDTSHPERTVCSGYRETKVDQQ